MPLPDVVRACAVSLSSLSLPSVVRACAVSALGLYSAWFVWSKKNARTSDRVLRSVRPAVAFALRALGPLLSVDYQLILDKSYKIGERMGWPYYNDTAHATQSIFTWHPHSALTVMPFTFFQSSSVFGNDVFIGVTSALYTIPILREILMIGNCRIADDAVVENILAQGKSFMIQPGGVYEQLHFKDDHEVAYFSSNLGFLRKAVSHGLPIVPSYSFGENQLYKSRPDRKGVSAFLSKLGLPTPAAAGKFGTPAGLLCLPGKPTLVVGAAIPVERVGKAQEDVAVKNLFERYLKALRAIWREHCHHLPEEVAKKGLRCVYRCKGGGEVVSDAQDTDDLLVNAFAATFCTTLLGKTTLSVVEPKSGLTKISLAM